MKTIAVYNLKGGVGKTSFAINFAWGSARLSNRRTLLWDLDGQGAATFILSGKSPARGSAQAIFTRETKIEKLIAPSGIAGVDLIAADLSLRGLDRLLFDLGGRKRLAKLLDRLADDYDRVILDCPPGLGEVADQILRSADIIIVPVIPSPLSQRALRQVVKHLEAGNRKPSLLLPVHSMVDRRRNVHREALAAHPDWPIIPMSSAVERMSSERAAIGAFAGTSPAGIAFRKLWAAVEKKL